MLPSELLLTTTRKGRIYPVFAPLDEEHKQLAAELIALYRSSIGKRRSDIEAILNELEHDLNFKLVRGLRRLLERRCVFKSRYVIEPVVARRAVFEAASKLRIKNDAERMWVIRAVAERLGVSIDELEASLWADRESEQILSDFAGLEPEELLRLYNLSLAQTLLFKASSMILRLRGSYSNYKMLFRAIKYLGLMYTPEGDGAIRIEGTLALLKLSERYGTALSKLLPPILSCGDWELDAEIMIRGHIPRVYRFVLDSRRCRHILPQSNGMEQLTFDSKIEELFYKEFLALPVARKWELIREPDAIFTAKGVFIPDFKFVHRELPLEIYFEIVGFWTEDYLRKKMAKLHALPFDIIVAIDRNLACSTLRDDVVHGTVIEYSRKVPVIAVVRYLEKIERAEIERQVKRMKEVPLKFDTGVEIVRIGDIAERYGVSKEVIRAVCESHKEIIEDYIVFKDVLVKRDLLERLRERMRTISSYVDARELIEAMGLPADDVLSELGFKVVWKGLDIEAATITDAS